jgi:hypothetical protein
MFYSVSLMREFTTASIKAFYSLLSILKILKQFCT